MRSARTSQGSGETMGCLRGGHERLIEAAAARATELGVDVRVNAGVDGLVLEDGRVAGVVVDGRDERFDLTLATLQPPALQRLLPDELGGLLDAYPQRFLGVVCLILKLRRSLLPYYSVNICDETPMTTVVETSHVVGTDHTDGLTLSYLPKYCEASSETFRADDRTIYDRFTAMLRKLVPDFTEEDVVDWTVQRAPLVEPVHSRDHAPRTAPIWPAVEGLGLASASQVYPRLLNGDSIVGLAEQVAGETAERLGLPGIPAAAPLAAAA
jgi:protoporphyrinogen oxidase